jgi:hypothetical protein
MLVSWQLHLPVDRVLLVERQESTEHGALSVPIVRQKTVRSKMMVSQYTLPVDRILLVESQESTKHRAHSVSVILFIR